MNVAIFVMKAGYMPRWFENIIGTEAILSLLTMFLPMSVTPVVNTITSHGLPKSCEAFRKTSFHQTLAKINTRTNAK